MSTNFLQDVLLPKILFTDQNDISKYLGIVTSGVVGNNYVITLPSPSGNASFELNSIASILASGGSIAALNLPIASLVRLDCSSSTLNIQGINSSGHYPGKPIVLQAVSGIFTLLHQNTAAATGNRIFNPNLNTLTVNSTNGEHAVICYDNLLNRWITQVVPFNASSGSSGGSPGGSNTQVQFNNSSAFGGSSAFTWTNGTNLLTLTNKGGGGTPSLKIIPATIEGGGGGNDFIQFTDAGGTSVVARISATGQYESLMTTASGSPIIVASSGLVTNFNAHYLNGYTAAALLAASPPKPNVLRFRPEDGFNGSTNVCGSRVVPTSYIYALTFPSSNSEHLWRLTMSPTYAGSGFTLNAVVGGAAPTTGKLIEFDVSFARYNNSSDLSLAPSYGPTTVFNGTTSNGVVNNVAIYVTGVVVATGVASLASGEMGFLRLRRTANTTIAGSSDLYDLWLKEI